MVSTGHAEILQRYHITPKKSLGQNFLVNDEILSQIAAITRVKGEHIIEVWPGYGALTAELLAQQPLTLTLVEYDSEMIKILLDRIKRWDFGEARLLSLEEATEFRITQDQYPLTASLPPKKSLKVYPEIHWQVGSTLLTIHQGDVLDFNPIRTSKVIANIPYYITSPILFRFLYSVTLTPLELIILMQKEVADKIWEVRGNKPSYLSTAITVRSQSIKESLTVTPDNFAPPPKVDSSVLHLVTRPWDYPFTQEQFLQILGAGHLHPRKKLVSNLAEGLLIDKKSILQLCLSMGLGESVRAGELCMGEWERLVPSLLKASRR
jgi:16S rRNA (adenine1518-N6/adenine1519-N6)-dimethyltransferase